MQKRMGTSIRGETARRAAFRLRIVLLAAVAAFLAAAPSAHATFHLIKVREVHPGPSDESYVELQMYASGQSLLGGHSLTLYSATGSLIHTSTFSGSVAHSANQQTVLIGDTAVQSTFGVAPDLLDSGLSISAAGGAACWNAGGFPADCVAWGNFTGQAALQAATGTGVGSPASPSGIAAGKAIRRKISSGCPTLLEEADDTDASAADFEEAVPAPRNDSSPIAESVCAGAPNTVIDDRPPQSSSSTGAEFTYEAPTATSYECRLDAQAFAACPAGGKAYADLTDGSHTFQVRGVNASGPDPTPASYTWTVDTVAPTASITSHPVDPSPGKTAAFRYSSNEGGSKFECRLAPPEAGFSPCNIQPKTYTGLADGSYEFEVRAVDAAGNAQATATAFSWTVDNSLADTTPPDTSIATKPSDPSDSSTATFTYGSSEPESTFQCKLDGASFTACPSAGIAYSGLGEGQHTFQVRAIDSSENTDPSPAGYTFNVVLPPSPGSGQAGSSPPASPAASLPPPTAAPVVVKRHRHRRRHRHRHHHHGKNRHRRHRGSKR
jgi:hypothetical protein